MAALPAFDRLVITSGARWEIPTGIGSDRVACTSSSACRHTSCCPVVHGHGRGTRRPSTAPWRLPPLASLNHRTPCAERIRIRQLGRGRSCMVGVSAGDFFRVDSALCSASQTRRSKLEPIAPAGRGPPILAREYSESPAQVAPCRRPTHVRQVPPRGIRSGRSGLSGELPRPRRV